MCLSQVDCIAGESWAADVRKMVAVHDTDGELGVIYLDLFPRSVCCFACRFCPDSSCPYTLVPCLFSMLL